MRLMIDTGWGKVSGCVSVVRLAVVVLVGLMFVVINVYILVYLVYCLCFLVSPDALPNITWHPINGTLNKANVT